MSKKPKLYWTREGEAWIGRPGIGKRVAVIEYSFFGNAYVVRKRPRPGPYLIQGAWIYLADAKRAVERHLGMERGR